MADQAAKRMYAGIVFGVAVICGVIVLWWLRGIVLMAFLAATIAVLFNWLAGMLRRLIPKLGQGVALAIVIVGLLAAFIGVVNLIARPVVKELTALIQAIDENADTIQKQAEEWATTVLGSETSIDVGDLAKEALKSTGTVARFALHVVSGAGGAVLSIAVVLSLAVFFSIKPGQYNAMLLKYSGQANRERTRRVLDTIAVRLRGWLGGTLFSALFIAVFSTLGLLIMRVKYAHVFGILAGLLAFVPYFGPIIAVVPPAVATLIDAGPLKALWVVVLFVAIQTVESNVFTPMVMHRRIDMPPGVVVLAVMVMGALFGFLGAVLALPLTLAAQAVVDEFVLNKQRPPAADGRTGGPDSTELGR
jgi:predicted PurR-regulated permease PerM